MTTIEAFAFTYPLYQKGLVIQNPKMPAQETSAYIKEPLSPEGMRAYAEGGMLASKIQTARTEAENKQAEAKVISQRGLSKFNPAREVFIECCALAKEGARSGYNDLTDENGNVIRKYLTEEKRGKTVLNGVIEYDKWGEKRYTAFDGDGLPVLVHDFDKDIEYEFQCGQLTVWGKGAKEFEGGKKYEERYEFTGNEIITYAKNVELCGDVPCRADELYSFDVHSETDALASYHKNAGMGRRKINSCDMEFLYKNEEPSTVSYGYCREENGCSSTFETFTFRNGRLDSYTLNPETLTNGSKAWKKRIVAGENGKLYSETSPLKQLFVD